jgi:hypothetical protein
VFVAVPILLILGLQRESSKEEMRATEAARP